MSTAQPEWPIDAAESMLIECPWCGEREESEFSYGGAPTSAYPDEPSTLASNAWAEFLFCRDNQKGWFHERWMHSAGCRRWFNALRHTVTYEFAGSYKPGELPPVPPAPPESTSS